MPSARWRFLNTSKFYHSRIEVLQNSSSFFDSVSFMTGKFEGMREFLFQEIRAYMPLGFLNVRLCYSVENSVSWLTLDPLQSFAVYSYYKSLGLKGSLDFENHIMIYIEAEKKKSLRSVARGISVGRKLVSKYLVKHLWKFRNMCWAAPIINFIIQT